MKINDLFEQKKQYYFEFSLELSEEFSLENANRILSTILAQSETKLLHSRVGDEIGPVTVSTEPGQVVQHEPVLTGGDWVQFTIFSFDRDNRDYAQKLLRRLSRGKPQFKILFAR